MPSFNNQSQSFLNQPFIRLLSKIQFLWTFYFLNPSIQREAEKEIEQINRQIIQCKMKMIEEKWKIRELEEKKEYLQSWS